MNDAGLSEPWLSFLAEIDRAASSPRRLHCLGGFVVTQVYGSQRTTSDLDALTLIGDHSDLFQIGGIGSDLHKRYKVYLDPVGIATLPENYGERLKKICDGLFKNLGLFALDPYDLALAKIERNIERDRDDVKFLFRKLSLELDILSSRYFDELRPYLAIPEREDLTLKLWCEMIAEEAASK